MDTWATSSLTPQIQSHWGTDDERHHRLFPMDIRPQAHDIIRTWAFYTIVKAWMHSGEIPWYHVILSGWILDPDRKKMSKSKGNVVTPDDLLVEFSSDAVRYWAARARLGTDTTFDPAVFKIGKRLSTKVFNASRFVFMQLEGAVGDGEMPGVESITEPLDLALVERMRTVIDQATRPSTPSTTPPRCRSSRTASGASAITISSWSSCAPMPRRTPPAGDRPWPP